MTEFKQRIEVQVWAHPSSKWLQNSTDEKRSQTRGQLLDGLRSGIQTQVGESTWPASFRVGSEESEMIVSEGQPEVEIQSQ